MNPTATALFLATCSLSLATTAPSQRWFEPGSAASAEQFTQFVDPNEGAFQIEVPAGWQVRGGMYRNQENAALPMLEVVSPDGRIRIRSGDASIPSFREPSHLLPAAEGQRIAPATMVRRFVRGAEFAAEFARIRLAGGAIEVVGGRERPDLAREAAAALRQSGPEGMHHDVSTGEIEFRAGGQSGYACAETVRGIWGGMSVAWHVQRAYGFVCAPGSEAAAHRVLAHMLATSQPNPQWLAREQQSQAQLTRIHGNEIARRQAATSRYLNDMSEIRRAGPQSLFAAQDRTAWSSINALRGTIDVADPTTGERFNTTNPHTESLWRRDFSNTIHGTNSFEHPPIGWTRVEAVRR